MNKAIHSSHLALRFYKHSWTKEELEPYLIKGQIIDQIYDQETRDYYWLDHRCNSQMDMKRLYEEMKPRVFTYEWEGEKYGEVTGDAAIAYMRKFNW